MNILYLVTTLPPKMPACEAISQEISALCRRFGGGVVYLNPNQRSPLYVPRLLFGFHKLKELRLREASTQLHHLYNPDPFPFPLLKRLRRPVIYSVTCGIRHRRPDVAFFSRLAAVTAADNRSLALLQSWGLRNVFLVRPGIDTSRFTWSPLPLQRQIRLMVGSAPWTRAQFSTKGVDALLAAAQRCPHLQLVFLWRDVLAAHMEERVHRMQLTGQVEVLNAQVDVNKVLAGVHASVTLAADPAIVKSYPHSLLESLAAGKPVLVSRAIPMADYVEQTGCGKVVEHMSSEDILEAIEALRFQYDDLQKAAREAGRRDFTLQMMLDSHRHVYEHVLGAPMSIQ
jgi:glycosyltransferase involved in cell wall biosynthesis